MADRLRDLSEREQRIEIMRRNGVDFRDEDGNWIVPPGNGFASSLVRGLFDDDPDDDPNGGSGNSHAAGKPTGLAA